MRYTQREIEEQQANQMGVGCFAVLLLIGGLACVVFHGLTVAARSEESVSEWLLLGIIMGMPGFMIALMPSRGR